MSSLLADHLHKYRQESTPINPPVDPDLWGRLRNTRKWINDGTITGFIKAQACLNHLTHGYKAVVSGTVKIENPNDYLRENEEVCAKLNEIATAG